MYRYLLCSLFFVFLPPLAIADEVIDRAMQATVMIFPAGLDDQAGGGSGVLISPDGYALTNFHVVQPCGPAMKCAVDGKLYDAIIVGMDPVGDIALIKLRIESGELRIKEDKTDTNSQLSILNSQFAHAELADSDLVQVGDTAIVMGNPFLLALDLQPCVSKGIISGVHRYQFPSGSFLEYTDCLQTDAAVNPGNSGGPLFNDKGEVIGIIGRCSFEKRGRVNVGIGYAVSSNQVRNFLGDLKSGRIVDHATMNATVQTDRDGRVVFSDVLGTSDAYRSGLRYDDELLRFADRAIDTANTFKNIVGIFPKNWRLPATVRGKDGVRYDLLIRLGALHGEASLIEMTEKMIEPPIVPKKNEKSSTFAASPCDALIADGDEEKLERREHFVPDNLKPFYEKQRGYANFYFNRIELKRVLNNWRKNFDATDKPWKLAGQLAGRPERYSFEIDGNGVAFDLPVEKGFWNANQMKRETITVPDPLMHYQAPRGSGGLFTALYLLRLLVVGGDNFDFGEVVYVGTAPVLGNTDKLFDVAQISWLGNDVRFFFDPENGRLALIEMFGSALDFPCEVYFRLRDGRNEMEVRYGRILFGIFDLETLEPAMSFDPQVLLAEQIHGTKTASTLISDAQSKVVKIYGAGNIPGMHGYQAGVLISADGYVLTALTAALQADPLTIVLDNGRKYEARMVDADPLLEMALLKIPATELPFFELRESTGATRNEDKGSDLYGFGDSVQLGEPVYAVSNPFNIAVGNESATVQRGKIASRTTLRARRGVFETPYKGPVYVVDFTTNNPGAAGGALVLESNGELIGLLGKELRNSENGAWLNFAIPVFALWEKVTEMMTRNEEIGTKKPILVSPDAIKPEKELIPEDTVRIMQDWGILLVTTVGRRTPPFIDTVKAGSEAEKLGVMPDDLIVMINNRLTPSRSAVEYHIHQTPSGEQVTLTLERDRTLVDVKFTMEVP